MIRQFRHMTESWIARGFFFLMALAFVAWGISTDLLRVLTGSPTWVAKAGGQPIEIPAFQVSFQRAMAQQTRNLPAGQEPSPAQRRQVGQQVLNQMIVQAALGQEMKDLHVVSPDNAVLEVIHSMPAFRDSSGQFSRAVFENVLRNNGYTEDRFVAELRADISQRQILSALSGTVGAPAAEVTPLYQNEFEKRSVDTAMFPLSAMPEPATPDQAQLQRWYDNHPDSYRTPEYRRIKAVELTPQSLASDIQVSDDELHAAYDEHRSEYVTPAKRSAEVISAPDEAKAKALAEQWRNGADWAAMQKAAQADGASAITQDDAAEVQFPDPDLAKAVFAAQQDQVADPVKGALGWFVVEVTRITPGKDTSFEQAKESLRARVLASKAADLMYDRANKVDQILGNASNLDELPNDLGLVGVAGSLDAEGNTPEGRPAPIPGSAELKQALITAAFQTQPGDPPHLTEVQTPSTGGSAYYALVVEKIDPPHERPFDEVKDQVAEDWKQDQRQRAANAAATAMMTAVQGGKPFSDAATIAGVQPHLSPLLTRNQSDPNVPPELQRAMFGLKKSETTMVQLPDGFVVAQLVEIKRPNPADDKAGYDQAKTAVQRSIGDDATAVFVNALRQRANPQINQQGFNSVVQP
ncbi:MAG TPA: peptidyl-prolyl cis-trans isomerase [Rhodopila sp.]|nr:peptidyl-prolyl cis-trans isomerase [Rhodopila sp.]